MKMRWVYLILSVFGIVVALFAVVQFVMAICHMELGRVAFYLLIAALCAELAVLSILKVIKQKDKTK